MLQIGRSLTSSGRVPGERVRADSCKQRIVTSQGEDPWAGLQLRACSVRCSPASFSTRRVSICWLRGDLKKRFVKLI